ncbi:hypothetical protein DPMN_178439 [Dreissena polymorpha]|uniref:Uncharacterized protein n=1 Tax=Dreissena polymorpha TaxID=45954 RepID=A0A9D4IJW0_DREPO|nr:hypothetical protein DPMN_178439 [Dreissena polymorpha]
MSNLEEKLSRLIERVDCLLDEIKSSKVDSAEVRTLDGVMCLPMRATLALAFRSTHRALLD